MSDSSDNQTPNNGGANDPQNNNGDNSNKPPNNTPPGLRPWVKGQSGNPKGRPKRPTISEALYKHLRTTMVQITIPKGNVTTTITVSKWEAFITRMADKMVNGDMRTIEYFGERLDPRVKTKNDAETGRPRAVNLPSGGPWGGTVGVRKQEPKPAEGGAT